MKNLKLMSILCYALQNIEKAIFFSIWILIHCDVRYAAEKVTNQILQVVSKPEELIIQLI